MIMKIKNNIISFFVFTIICFMLSNFNVFALNVYQSNYFYINDYVSAYKNISSSTSTIHGKYLIEFVDYIENYINSNKTVDVNYSIFINLLSNNDSEVIFSLSRNHNCSTSFSIYSDIFQSDSYLYKVNIFSTGESSECVVGGTGSDSKVFVFKTNMSVLDFDSMLDYLNDFITDNQSSAGYNQSFSNFGNRSVNFDFNQDINLSIQDITTFLPYKTTNVIYYKKPVELSGSNYKRFERDLIINYSDFNEIYKVDTVVPTFLELYDLYPEKPDVSFNFKDIINDYYGFFISQVPVSNIYDLKLDFTVHYSSSFDDINYKYNLIGRINYNSYYTYETISCDIGTSNDEPLDVLGFSSYTKHLSISNCSSDISKYDYIYINAFSDNLHSISYFKYTTNYGKVSVNDFNTNILAVVDYFDFDSNTNLFISSKKSHQSLFYGSKEFNKFLVTSYDLSTFNYKKYYIANRYDKNYAFYEKYNYIGTETNTVVGVNLFSNYSSGNFYVLVDNNIAISINKVDNIFNYYDSSGNIISNNFNVYTSFLPDSNTNSSVDNYFSIVVDYIDSFSSDIKQFSVVLQNCYDLAPEFIRNLIFVLFILSMSVILYKLIGK